MLTNVLITSLGLFVRSLLVMSSPMHLSTHSVDLKRPWSRVKRLRLPLEIVVVLNLRLLQWLDGLVFVDQQIPAFVISDEVRDDATDRITVARTFSVRSTT
jgi:hypothetical protein